MEIGKGEAQTGICLEASWNIRIKMRHDIIPDGVTIVTAGGLKGYSGGNLSVPENQ
jgi:hypothetical protein